RSPGVIQDTAGTSRRRLATHGIGGGRHKGSPPIACSRSAFMGNKGAGVCPAFTVLQPATFTNHDGLSSRTGSGNAATARMQTLVPAQGGVSVTWMHGEQGSAR